MGRSPCIQRPKASLTRTMITEPVILSAVAVLLVLWLQVGVPDMHVVLAFTHY